MADPGITDPRLLKESQEPWASEGIFGYPQLGRPQNPVSRLALSDPSLGKRLLFGTPKTHARGALDRTVDEPSHHITLRAGLGEERATEDPITTREFLEEHYYGGATSFPPVKDKEAIVYADYEDLPYDERIAKYMQTAFHETFHDVLQDPEMKETRTISEEFLVKLMDWVSSDDLHRRETEDWVKYAYQTGDQDPATLIAFNLRPRSGGRNNLDRFFKIANRKLEEQGRPTVDTDWIDEIISDRFASGEIVDWDVPLKSGKTRKLSSYFPAPEQVEE